ncbi:MAG: glycosyltransferase [Candidatus Micrarchaeia archaeon]
MHIIRGYMFSKELAFRLATVLLFLIMSSIGIVISAYLMLTAVTPFLYAIALSFLILSIISGIFNISSAYSYYRSSFYPEHLQKLREKLKPLEEFPTVAIAVPVYNEDAEMVKRNLIRLKAMNYDKSKLAFYLLDDSTIPETTNQLRLFCEKEGIIYLHRDNRKGFKGGALNNMLKYSKEDFIAIFDSDEYLTDENFLMELLPYFENKKVAFVQTEKRYAKGTFFSSCVDLFDAFFFKFIQPSRALNNTAIFAGSCGLIRRSALDEIGGFPEFVIEDTFFSFESDAKGFKSVYIPKVYALGKPITTFTELARQQWRYNYGDTQFLLHFLKHWKENKRRTMSALSKIDYALHGLGLNYLSITLILFTVVSVLSVFASAPVAYIAAKQLLSFKYPSFNIELFGLNAFLLSILVPIAITKLYFNSVSKGIMIFALNFALAFVRLRAAIAALFNARPTAGWIKGGTLLSKNIMRSFKNAYLELVFSAGLFASSAFAFMSYNLSGGLWLLWYGLLYGSTFLFFYLYG